MIDRQQQQRDDDREPRETACMHAKMRLLFACRARLWLACLCQYSPLVSELFHEYRLLYILVTNCHSSGQHYSPSFFACLITLIQISNGQEYPYILVTVGASVRGPLIK